MSSPFACLFRQTPPAFSSILQATGQNAAVKATTHSIRAVLLMAGIIKRPPFCLHLVVSLGCPTSKKQTRRAWFYYANVLRRTMAAGGVSPVPGTTPPGAHRSAFGRQGPGAAQSASAAPEMRKLLSPSCPQHVHTHVRLPTVASLSRYRPCCRSAPPLRAFRRGVAGRAEVAAAAGGSTGGVGARVDPAVPQPWRSASSSAWRTACRSWSNWSGSASSRTRRSGGAAPGPVGAALG